MKELYKKIDWWIWWTWNVRRQHLLNWFRGTATRKVKKLFHIHKWEKTRTSKHEMGNFWYTFAQNNNIRVSKVFYIDHYRCKCGEYKDEHVS